MKDYNFFSEQASQDNFVYSDNLVSHFAFYCYNKFHDQKQLREESLFG